MALKKIGEYLLFFFLSAGWSIPLRGQVVDTLPAPRETPDTARFVPQRSEPEAAAIDGCGPVRSFFYIILPQLKSVTASVVILTGIHCWNDYQFSLYILQSSKMRTVTLAISSFFSQTTSNLNAASAAALLAILPVVVCFLFLQKYFIKGMVDSAVK